MLRITLLIVTMLTLLTGELRIRDSAFGLNIGSQGSGIMYQRRWEMKPNLFTGAEIRFFDIKSKDELIIYDYYSGQSYTVNDQSLVMIPIFGSLFYFPFHGKIENNFTPFITAKAGPLITINGDESYARFVDRWQSPEFQITLGGYIGVGTDILWMGGSVLSISVGMDIFPMRGRVDGKTQYSGLLFQIAFGRRK